MRTNSKSNTTSTEIRYHFTLDDGRKVEYTEYLNERGRVMDQMLVNEDTGDHIFEGDEPETFAAIQKHLDDTEGA